MSNNNFNYGKTALEMAEDKIKELKTELSKMNRAFDILDDDKLIEIVSINNSLTVCKMENRKLKESLSFSRIAANNLKKENYKFKNLSGTIKDVVKFLEQYENYRIVTSKKRLGEALVLLNDCRRATLKEVGE